MSDEAPLAAKVVAISMSESADMAVLGLAEEHLRDAMAEVARHLLAMGTRLAYGGDLRALGFTNLLFELVARHRGDAGVDGASPGVLSYLAWPVHSGRPASEIHALADDLAGAAELRCLDRRGSPVPLDALAREPRIPTDEEWNDGLTSMRKAVTEAADARVVLGGRVTDYKGRMPGIGEEVLLSLRAGQPLFLLGGFGGCARDVAQDLGLLAAKSPTSTWPNRGAFGGFSPSDLNNGLTDRENRTLARTVHVDQAVALILRGLLRLAEPVVDPGLSSGPA